MADLGTSIAGVTSIGPRFNFASGNLCLAYSLARRLITPRASLPWAPNDGTDMRDFLNKGDTASNRFAAARAAHDECLKDERVQDVTVTAKFLAAGQQLQLTIAVLTANGPFTLVVTLNQLTISDLAVS